MQGRRLIIGATAVGLAGLVLMGLETARALRGSVLGTSGTALLFTGLGLVVVAAVVAIVSLGVDTEVGVDGLDPAADPAPAAAPAAPVTTAAPREPTVVDVTDPTPQPAPAAAPARATVARPATGAPSALATLRGGSTVARASEADATDVDPPATSVGTGDRVTSDEAAGWSLLCRADGAGRVEAGPLSTSVRRGATLVAYREGVLVGIGKVQRHQSWAQISTITATLGGSEARVTVRFTNGDGLAEATFTGKNGDLAPVATALVSAAPAGVVAVSYS